VVGGPSAQPCPMTGRPDVLDRNLALRALAVQQSSVVSRRQLRICGITADSVAYQINARRWAEPVAGVVILHCGPVIEPARMWLAVLAGGQAAAVCSWSALALHGLEGWTRPRTHIVVPRGRHVPALEGVVVHESRRHTPADVARREGLPVHRVERAAVDAAAWSASVRTACGLLAAVVQQGLTTPERLIRTLDEAGRVSHRRPMLLALVDIGGGSRALSEIDLVRMCRTADLPEPARQRVRLDARGRRRYLDAEWSLPGGRRLMLEVDGVHHMDVSQWYDDLLRQAEVARPGRDWVVRIPATAARLEPERVVAILRRALASLAAQSVSRSSANASSRC
jgi:hypothetical protein